MDEFKYNPDDHVIPDYCEIPMYIKNIVTGDRVKIVVRSDDERRCRILLDKIKEAIRDIMDNV